MKTQKKSWKKPVLIVIGRGTPEERVLAGCKGPTAQGKNNTECRPGTSSCKDTSGS